MQMIIIYMVMNVNPMRGLHARRRVAIHGDLLPGAHKCTPYEKSRTTSNASCGLVNG